MYHLSDALQAKLLHLPESGMGYQVLEIVTDTNERLKAIAFNAELVLPDRPEQRSLLREYWQGKLAIGGYGREIREVHLLPRSAAHGWMAFSARESRGAYGGRSYTGPAKDAPREKTKANEVFRRFSAFEHDRRIAADGSLTPGTYATTYRDSEQVRTGKEAVARYALPNPEPAVHRFTATPKDDLTIQYGIVEPANGQTGGGEEVLFADGTNPGSVVMRDMIPPG